MVKALVAVAGLALMGFGGGCSSSSGGDQTSSGSTTSSATGGTGTGGGTSGGATTGTSTGPATFLDTRDNQTYPEVVIGSQTWLAANMNFETPSGSSCYNGDPANCATYGRLYTFAAAAQACPSGWHLATDSEWMTLEMTLGMTSTTQLDINGETKARGTDQGTQLEEGGSSGFEAKLGGYQTGPDYYILGSDGYFWTSTEQSSLVWRRHIDSSTPYLYRFNNPIDTFAISVRCLMGALTP